MEGEMNIILTIEIANVENWDIKWTDENVKIDELKKLNWEIKSLIAEHIGVYYQNIYVQSELL